MIVNRLRGLTAVGLFVGLVASGGVLMATVEFLDADAKASIIGDGSSAVVTGRIQCTDGHTMNIQAIIAQNVRQDSVISTGFEDDDVCNGEVQAFVIPVEILFPADGKFKKGPASLTLQAQSCDPITFECSDPVALQTKVHMQ